MDILNSVTPITASIFLGAQSQGEFRPLPKSDAPQAQNSAPAVPNTADKVRYQEVKKAAESYVSNYYVVSDVRFTIFKDVAGDYVTRFTSLKDGSVKYYPQKDLFELIQIRRAAEKAIYDAEA